MNRTALFPLFVCLGLLSACGGTAAETPPVSSTPEPAEWYSCRIISGAEEGQLVLAGTDNGEVYTLSTGGLEVMLDSQDSTAQLQNGMLVEVGFDGTTMETFPVQFSKPTALKAQSGDINGRYDLYLQVLEDLWEVDPGLNEGITELGVDLSGVTDLTDGERSALAYVFGMEHNLMPISGTWEELVDEGTIDREHLYWEDGCLFSITGNASFFDAQKWASGTGAYFFSACTGTESDGIWTYEVGAHAIA